MTTKLDVFKGTCQEFGKVFSEDLASLDAIDDKVQHHAEALTNCLKLVQSSPDSPSVQRLWTWLIRSAVNTLLFIDQPPSSQSLRLFVETIRPWLINENFSGLCHKELRDMCNLATNGPWTHPVLQRLISGANVELQEITGVFDDGLECIEYRIRSLHLSTKIKELVQFGTAALTHSKVKKNNAVQKVYQSCAYHVLSEVDLTKQIQYFDLDITITLIDELIKEDINCQKLCNAVIKYLWQNKIMDRLQEVTEQWITLLYKFYPGGELFDFLTKNIVEGEAPIQSVQQCVTVASALWKVVPETSRMMCVEILCHSLHLLSSDDPDCDQLKNGILSSIAYFLPNSQVARSCALTIFIQNPSIDNYFKVAKTYKVPYDREKDIAANFKAHYRLSLLEYLHQQWSHEFLQSNSWDWPRLRTLCYDSMAPEDVNYVQQVEREEQENTTEECVEDPEKNTGERKPQPIPSLHPTRPSFETLPISQGSVDGSDVGVSGHNKSTTEPCDGDSCDCVACELKLKEKGNQSCKSPSPRSKEEATRTVTTHADTTTDSVADRGQPPDEVTVTCPEESCRRVICSKSGMSRHLSRTHHWSLPEIHFFYTSLEKEGLLPPAKSCKNDLATLKTDDKLNDTGNGAGNKEVFSPREITENDAEDLTQADKVPHVDRLVSPSPDHEPKAPTPTRVSVLPEVLPKGSVTQDPSVAKQKELQKFQIKCPVSTCSRVFRHRHTIKAHIEFRHNVNPAKAATMAKEAAYVDDPNPGSTRGNDLTNQTDISRSRGWYWLVDDFIDEDIHGEGDSRSFNRKSDTNLRSSVARDIICTLGNAPLSYDLAGAETYIVGNWKFAARYSRAGKEVDEELPPAATLKDASTSPGEISFDNDNLLASPEFEFNHMEEEMQPAPPEPSPPPPPVTKSLSDVKPLLQVKVKLKSSKPTFHQESFPPELVPAEKIREHPTTPTAKVRTFSAATNTRSVACQTKFKTTDFDFNEVDHYHNLPNVKNKKPHKARSNEKFPISVTVLSGSMFGRPVCSQSSQCCSCDRKVLLKQTMSRTKVKRAAPVKKRKSSEIPLKSTPIFSSDSEEAVAFTTKQIKRKYDAQSVYNIADKCREVLIDTKPRAEKPSGVGSSKPSFEDALNYAPTAPQPQDKPKAPRKRSLSKSMSDEQRTDLRHTSSAHTAVSTGDVTPDQTTKQKVKKRKLGRARLPSVTKKSKPIDISNMNKKDEEDAKQLVPCQDYEELLKQAEELNSAAAKPKATKSPVASKTDFKTIVSKTPASKTPSVPTRQSSIEDKSDTILPPVSEPTVPSRAITEKEKKKSNRISKGKRMISLRNLSSKNVQQNETFSVDPTEENSETLDESMSAPSEQGSVCIASTLQEEAPTEESSLHLKQPISTSPPSTLSSEVLCPECLKPMSSAFALTCHMRKRHKGHSKKMFFPGQTPDVPQSAPGSDKSEKKHKKKASKNEHEPPEGCEASSVSATPRLAPINTNASATSSDSLDNNDCHLEESTSDMSSATERDTCTQKLDPSENLPPSSRMPLLNLNLPAKPQSIVISSSNVIFTTTVTSLNKGGHKNDPATPLPATTVITQPTNDNCTALKPIQGVQKDSTPSQSLVPSDRNLSSEADKNEPISINVLDGKFLCPFRDCNAKYAHRRSLLTHTKLKHPSIHARLLHNTRSHHPPCDLQEAEPSRTTPRANKNEGIGAVASDDSSTNHTERTPRRLAYTEANLQIQFFSGNPSSRKWAERQELAHLYTKRIRRKIALSLSPAQKKVKSLKSKLHQKRSREESSDSTDSFEADYDAQLPCWSCDAIFHRRKNLTKHIQHHLRHIDRCPFRCDQRGCLFGFRTADELALHKTKHKPRNQICLFCPNQSRSFKSLRKVIIHEHIAHPHLQVNMVTLRRTMCLTPPKWSLIYSEKYIAEEISAGKRRQVLDEETNKDSQLSDADEVVTNSSFLATGHRRAADQGDDCDACEKSGPSVAEHCRCEQSIRKSVTRLIHDLAGTVEDYHWLHRKDEPSRTTPVSAHGRSGCTEFSNKFSVDLSLSVNEEATDNAVPLFVEEEKTLKDEILSSHKEAEKDSSHTEKHEEVPVEVGQDTTNPTKIVKLLDESKCSMEKQSYKDTLLLNDAPDITISPSKDPVEDCQNNTHPQVNSETAANTSDVISNTEMPSSPNNFIGPTPCPQPMDPSLVEHCTVGVSDLPLPDERRNTSQVDIEESLPETFYFDVYQTLHKIVCDVEIEEQANYMRICGYVPTGVMYFKQCDLANEPGVGLSVFGYNCHAFLSMEQSGSSTDTQTNILTETPTTSQSIMDASQTHLDETETVSDAVLAVAKDPGPGLSSGSCDPLSATTAQLSDEVNSADEELTLKSFQSDSQHTEVASASIPFAIPPAEGGVGCADPNLNRALIQSNLLSLYSIKFHPTWTLDADESHSDLCNISQIPPLSRKLFCQHFVVPSPSLNLPPAPLNGICSPFPVTSDHARSSAFSDVSCSDVNQAEKTHPLNSSLEEQPPDDKETEQFMEEASHDHIMDDLGIPETKTQSLSGNAELESDDAVMSDTLSKTLSSSSDEDTGTSSSSEENRDCPPPPSRVLNQASDDSLSQPSQDPVSSASAENSHLPVSDDEPTATEDEHKCNAASNLGLDGSLHNESSIEEAKPGKLEPSPDMVTNEIEAVIDKVCSNSSGTALTKADNLEDLAVHHFMEDLKAGLKERKPHQSDVLKPANVFKSKGRFQLSLGVQSKVSKKRRNLSEIVAFCDSLTESDVTTMTLEAKRRLSIREAREKRLQKIRLQCGVEPPKKKHLRKQQVDPGPPKKRGRPKKQRPENATNQFNNSPFNDGPKMSGVKRKLPKNKQLIPMVERLQTSVAFGKSNIGKRLGKSKLKKPNLRNPRKPSSGKDRSKCLNQVDKVAKLKKLLPKRKANRKDTAASVNSTSSSHRPRDLPRRSCLSTISFESEQFDEDTEAGHTNASNDSEYVPNSKELKSDRSSGKEKRVNLTRGAVPAFSSAVDPSQPLLRKPLSSPDAYFGLADYYKQLRPNFPDQCGTAKKALNLLENFSILSSPFRSPKPLDSESKHKKLPAPNVSTPIKEKSSLQTSDEASPSHHSPTKVQQPGSSNLKDICPVCRMAFFKRDSFLHHVNVSHIKTKLLYRCTVLGLLPFYFPSVSGCLFSFNTRAELSEHEHRHQSSLPVYCIFCPLWFPSISKCRQHIAMTHERPTSTTSKTPSGQTKASTNNELGQSTTATRNTQSYQSTFEKFIQRHSAQVILDKLQNSSPYKEQPNSSLSESAPLLTEPLEEARKSDGQEPHPLPVSLTTDSTCNLQQISGSPTKPEGSPELLSVPFTPVEDSCAPITVGSCQESFSAEISTTQNSIVQLSTVETSTIRSEAESANHSLSISEQRHNDITMSQSPIMQLSSVETSPIRFHTNPPNCLSTVTPQSYSSSEKIDPVERVTAAEDDDDDDDASLNRLDNDVKNTTTCDVMTAGIGGTLQCPFHNGTGETVTVSGFSVVSSTASSSSSPASVSLPDSLQTCSNSVGSESSTVISTHKGATTMSCAIMQPTFRNTTPLQKTTDADVLNLARIANQTKAITDLMPSASTSHRHALVNVVSTSDKVMPTVLPISSNASPSPRNVSSIVHTTSPTLPHASKLCSISICSLQRIQPTATVLLDRTQAPISLDASSTSSVGSMSHSGVIHLPRKLKFPSGIVSRNRLVQHLPTAEPTIVTPQPSVRPHTPPNRRHGASSLVVSGANRQLFIKPAPSQSIAPTDRVTIYKSVAVGKTVLRPPVFVNVCRSVTSLSTSSTSSSVSVPSLSKPAPSIEVNVQVPGWIIDTPVLQPQISCSRIHPSTYSSRPVAPKPPFQRFPIQGLPVPVSSTTPRKPEMISSFKKLSHKIPSIPRVMENQQNPFKKGQLPPATDAENKKAKLSQFSKVISKVVRDPVPPSPKKKRKLFIDLDNLDYTDFSVIECDYCGNMYSNFYDYQTHMLKDHSLFLCGYANCKAIYGSEALLFHHYREEHRKAKRRGSDDVSMTFSASHREKQKDHDAKSLVLATKVWNKAIPSIPPDERLRLFSRMKDLSTDQLLQILFQEVLAFTSKCRVFTSQDGEDCFRCPIHVGPVMGDKKALYFHMLEHRLSEIIDWLRARLKRNNIRRHKLDDHDVPKEGLHSSHDTFHNDDPCHEQSYDQKRVLDDDSLDFSCDKTHGDAEAVSNLKAARRIYKCRFGNCSKRFRNQYNFRRHMFNHSHDSRLAWYEQEGEVWPLFRGTVPLSRCSVPSTAKADPRCTHEASISQPKASPPQLPSKQSLTLTIHDVLRRPSKDLDDNSLIGAGTPSPVLKLPPTSPPISPRVVLKKLAPSKGVLAEKE